MQGALHIKTHKTSYAGSLTLTLNPDKAYWPPYNKSKLIGDESKNRKSVEQPRSTCTAMRWMNLRVVTYVLNM